MSPRRRPLRPDEADLVRWLLRHAAGTGVPGDLAGGLDRLLVVDQCDCGCPSVEFLVEGQTATASIAAEAEGTAPGGEPVGVLLWTRSGRLSGLEVYPLEGDGPLALPDPARLHPAARCSGR